MPDHDPHLMRSALAIATGGTPVFPLKPFTKVPALGSGWPDRATRDPDRIRSWWTWAPYNIGVVTGETIVVVDLDAPKQPHEPHGRLTLARLARAAEADLPRDTRIVTTPSGGQHLYFRNPPDTVLRNTAGLLGRHIDTRAVGGYVVGPGSIIDGRLYRLVRDAAPAPLPDWILRLWQARPRPQQPGPVPRHPAYVAAALRGVTADVADAAVGTRNATLFRAAARLGNFVAQGRLSEWEASKTLRAACGGHDLSESEVERTIRSGLRWGSGRPAEAVRHPSTVISVKGPQPARYLG
jgi:Bifunctional DNA primase/polymerase, N-terminal